MKTLVVEDDFVSRVLLQELLNSFGPTFVAVNGNEAVEMYKKSLEEAEPYDLICMDIMMPEMDGQQALKLIRQHESESGIYSSDLTKILMVTCVGDLKNVMTAYMSLCDGYLVKPVSKKSLYNELANMKLIDDTELDNG